MNNRRVLIASENIPLRRLYAKYLTSSGYLVNEVESAAAITIHCKTQKYAAILLHNSLKEGKFGLQLISEIKKIRPEIKIVFITGGDITAKAVMEAGGHALIKNKGTNNGQEVLNTIARLLNGGD